MATLLDLRIAELDHLNDLQDAAAGLGERYDKSALNRSINAAIRHYANHLNSFYQGYLSTSYNVNALLGVRTYATPAAFRSPIYEVRRVIAGTNIDVPLRPVHPYNYVVSTLNQPNASWYPDYYLEGANLVLSSAPDANEANALTVKHQKKITELANDVDALDAELYDAEECIAIYATILALRAKDVSGAFKNIEGWEAQLKECEKAFYMQVGNRYVRPDQPIPTQDMYDYL
jgi:hypothetical protein